MYNFDYLLDKIQNASFLEYPFQHLWIEDFLSEEHFTELISLKQINTGNFSSHEKMINTLQKLTYKPIPFPGCITDVTSYLDFLQNNHWPEDRTVEGFGMTLRLESPEGELLKTFSDFFKSQDFFEVVKAKFLLQEYPTRLETGIQKYLHKYEITPHPDSREKALTFMLNINPSELSEKENIHTHLCKLKKEYEYIVEVWENNLEINRCWVPWEYCTTEFMTTKNNSIVIFSPNNTTFHGVKLDYDHLRYQRTQIYGNLWYQNQDFPTNRLHYSQLQDYKK